MPLSQQAMTDLASMQVVNEIDMDRLRLNILDIAANWPKVEEKTIAYGRRDTTSSTSAGAVIGVMKLDNKPVRSGYLYRFVVSCNPYSEVASDRMVVEIRYQADGNPVTTASPVLPGSRKQVITNSTSSTAGALHYETIYVPGSDQTISFMLCFNRAAGTGNPRMYADSDYLTFLSLVQSGISPGNTAVLI